MVRIPGGHLFRQLGDQIDHSALLDEVAGGAIGRMRGLHRVTLGDGLCGRILGRGESRRDLLPIEQRRLGLFRLFVRLDLLRIGVESALGWVRRIDILLRTADVRAVHARIAVYKNGRWIVAADRHPDLPSPPRLARGA